MEVEPLKLELVPIWDAVAAGRALACFAKVPALIFFSSSNLFIYLKGKAIEKRQRSSIHRLLW